MYKTSCLCGIMFRDKYLDLYMRIYTVHLKLTIIYIFFFKLSKSFMHFSIAGIWDIQCYITVFAMA